MEFIDLKAQQDRIKHRLDARLVEVLAHGRYILGPEVHALESKLSAFSNSSHTITCANGTDALSLLLRAWNISSGDAVFCPSFSYCATAEVIAQVGATPVFVDIDLSSFNLCPESLTQAINQVHTQCTLTPKAVIIVDLFGQSANYPALSAIARKAGLKVISDNAQGFGTTWGGQTPSHWADAVTTSFFPAKPLGCYGDGGAIFTQDSDLDGLLRSLRFHGRDNVPYNHKYIGMNSRLDSLQAAVLLCKLEIFAEEVVARNEIAARYSKSLKDCVDTPFVREEAISTWAQYTIKTASPDRLKTTLSDAGIPSARYYPLPIHRQTAYRNFPISGNKLEVTDDVATQVISLPMHPYLSREDQDRIISVVKQSV